MTKKTKEEKEQQKGATKLAEKIIPMARLSASKKSMYCPICGALFFLDGEAESKDSKATIDRLSVHILKEHIYLVEENNECEYDIEVAIEDIPPGGQTTLPCTDTPSKMKKKYGRVDDDDVWEVKELTHECCPEMNDNYVIEIEQEARMKIEALAELSGSMEFLAYMLGELSQNKVRVDDVWIPTQIVGGASVDDVQDVPDDLEARIVGVLHKHPWKDATNFSGVDHAHVNANNMVSILINKDATQWTATAKKRSSCGRWITAKPSVVFVRDTNGFVESLKTEYDEKVKKRVYSYQKRGKGKKKAMIATPVGTPKSIRDDFYKAWDKKSAPNETDDEYWRRFAEES